MLPDRVSNPGPLTYESGALPIALRGPATSERLSMVCAPVRRDNPRALARGLSTVHAHKPCSISHVPQ